MYIETSGFTAGSAVVIDHAVCNMHGGVVQFPDDVVSSGVLNWGAELPEQLSLRLQSDLDRIQAAQVGKVSACPQFPYTYDMTVQSPLNGYTTMSPAVAAIAAALQQGRTVVGHGLLSFGWQFLAPFLPNGSDPASYSELLLEHVYDTANIEKAIQDDTAGSGDWFPSAGESRADWQRAIGVIRSKSKWSLRSHMFAKYELQKTQQAYYAADMLSAYVDIMQIWRSEGGQVAVQEAVR